MTSGRDKNDYGVIQFVCTHSGSNDTTCTSFKNKGQFLPALWWTWASLSASNTDLVHPPTSAEGEGHPSKRSALQEKKKNIHDTYQ